MVSSMRSNSNGSRTRNGSATSAAKPPLHRIDAVRLQEGVSRRSIARRLKITVAEVRRQECPTHDLALSGLYEWAAALRVPTAELLEEVSGKLSTPIAWRAKLVLVMKTSLAILERSKERSVCGLAERLVGQLLDIMPELVEVKS